MQSSNSSISDVACTLLLYCTVLMLLLNLFAAVYAQMRGFSVVYSDCIVSYSHIHEIAHNMGCEHDTTNSGHSTFWSYGEG
jgi:hypothetical protein